jgi:hypothetical protein
MRLSNKHANVQTVSFSDFSGGLNTTDAAETIAHNELSNAVNVEIYKGQLKTVAGTMRIYYQEDGNFTDMVFDSIGNTFLLIDRARKVYALPNNELVDMGTLTGDSAIQYDAWEDGVLIASGGKLQYYHANTLETLATSPDVCHGVFIKSGRVWVYYEDILHCSGVGDESNWETDSDDDSKSQWLQIGYKDGGYIVGVTSLSSDIVVLKSNRHAYHLAGDYPEWVVSEISRQIDCKCYNACVALVNDTVVLGNSNVQAITPTDTYGDMQARELAGKVWGDITALPPTVKLRYIPKLNQIWFLHNSAKFIFLDVNTGGWFKRQYVNPAVDAIEARGNVYVLKAKGLYILDSTTMADDNEAMSWSFQARTMVSDNEFLIKRVRVDTTPMHTHYVDEFFRVGNVILKTAQPYTSLFVYHNYNQIYHNTRDLKEKKAIPIYTNTADVYNNIEYIYNNPTYLKSLNMYRAQTRCVDRHKAIRVLGRGGGGVTVFNLISFDIVEV